MLKRNSLLMHQSQEARQYKSIALSTLTTRESNAGNVVTQRSHFGILTFLNMAPVYWFSKRQNTVESSTAVEYIMALQYKLRMFGPPDGPAHIFCNNKAVYKNSSDPASTLKRRHRSVAYHLCREAVAAGIVLVYKERRRRF